MEIIKYLFIIVVYLFIFSILRLIYMDIKIMSNLKFNNNPYLKLVNRRNSLPFKVEEHYNIHKTLTLGRDNNNSIIIKDPYISKKHLKFIIEDKKYYIEDLESNNGTFVNGTKLKERALLNNGDNITVGQVRFIFVKER